MNLLKKTKLIVGEKYRVIDIPTIKRQNWTAEDYFKHGLLSREEYNRLPDSKFYEPDSEDLFSEARYIQERNSLSKI